MQLLQPLLNLLTLGVELVDTVVLGHQHPLPPHFEIVDGSHVLGGALDYLVYAVLVEVAVSQEGLNIHHCYGEVVVDKPQPTVYLAVAGLKYHRVAPFVLVLAGKETRK